MSQETWVELNTMQTPDMLGLGKPAPVLLWWEKRKKRCPWAGSPAWSQAQGDGKEIKGPRTRVAGLALMQDQHLLHFLPSTPVTGRTHCGVPQPQILPTSLQPYPTTH